MKNLFRWLSRVKPDPDKFLAELQSSVAGSFTKKDRYRDFRSVFQGHSTPEQGKRVLWELTRLGKVYGKITENSQDSHQAYFRDGRRSMILEIFEIMNMEPSDKEDQPKNITKPKKEKKP